MPVLPYENIFPEIAKPYFLAENAYIIGDVKIKEKCSIMYGSVIRGDVNFIRIGKNVNIQDLVILHVTNITFPVIIGDNVSIGHGAKVHGCTIGNNVLIGIGAIILDGAKIGNNCMVAAGSVVKEGDIVEDNSLVAGIPAKLKRKITPKDLERIKYSASSYAEHYPEL
jgi:carbonic anhydrase/acetyltransferase-like protein (isoleucine patch superfamily)